ncbi:MAG: F0F1 ATP synthase subunit A [Bacteroidales bacterium]
MYNKICRLLFIVTLLFNAHGKSVLLASSDQVQAESHAVSHENESQAEETKAFEPGDFLFDHVKDAHDWHLFSTAHKHITIPLPVILYSNTKGLNVFMSSKFEHGHATYKGFRLETEGEKKNKIFEENGTMPLDLSITKNVAAMFFGLILLFWVFLSIGKAYRENPLSPPKGLQSLFEPVIVFLRDEIIKPSIGPKYERYMPFLLTIFFFILFNNILGLVPFPPGGANLTGNIAVTMVLALFTFVITTFSGNRNYWQHIFNTPGVPVWLKLPIPLMPFVETLGVFTKPLVLMIRLFANITAGHFIVLGFISLIYIFAQMSPGLAYGVSLVSIAFNVFMTFLELLVAFIQAFVFTFLSAIYFGMAVEEHHHEVNEHA